VATCDLLVIGGGPCGASAAIAGAQVGLSVTLVARPDAREKPGETAHPGIEPLLNQLGAGETVRAAGFFRHAGHWVVVGRRRTFIPYGSDKHGPWMGFQLFRRKFEALLLERAIAAGVTVRPITADNVLADGWRILGATFRGGGALRAPWTLDCTGRAHWLARRLKLLPRRLSRPLLAHYGYYAVDESGEKDPVFAIRPGSWTWTASVRPGVAAWTTLDLAGAGTIQRAPSTDGALGRLRGADVTCRHMPRCGGPGWLAGGDAALLLDPGAAQGIIRAVASGIAMAHLAAASLRGLINPDNAVAAHEEWMLRQRVHAVSVLRERYHFLVGLDPCSA
jgi:flavin-dependent dehydrogenase